MSKELEVLEQIKASHFQAHIESKNIGDFDIWFEEYYNLLRKALTAPTADEVCKALGKLRNCKVYYDSHLKRFYHTCGDEKKTIIGIDDNGLIYILWGHYKADFITFIGRFYEGLETHNVR